MHLLPTPLQEKSDQNPGFLDFGSMVNTASVYDASLSLNIRTTNVGAQNIYSSTLQIFYIALASFKMNNKLGKSWFFWETFLIANIDVEVSLNMLFLTFSNVNI